MSPDRSYKLAKVLFGDTLQSLHRVHNYYMLFSTCGANLASEGRTDRGQGAIDSKYVHQCNHGAHQFTVMCE